MGDYCNSLANKLEKHKLSDEENQNLESFSLLIKDLKNNLVSVQDELLSGGRILGSMGQEVNYLAKAYHKMNHTTVVYPHLRYDGHFTEGITERWPVAL